MKEIGVVNFSLSVSNLYNSRGLLEVTREMTVKLHIRSNYRNTIIIIIVV